MSDAENKLIEDLEEGEIKDEAFEDISECSLSEILVMQDDLENDSDVEHLREEALKSLPESDEITEEELYRLEALKSLLMNIESREKTSTPKPVGKKKRKRKKKVKQKSSHKHLKIENDVLENVQLSTESSDHHTIVSSLIASPLDADSLNKENLQASDLELATRSWYPITDLALLSSFTVQNSSPEEKPTKIQKKDDFILVPKVLSISNIVKKPITVPAKKQNNRFRKINAAPVSEVSRPQPLLSMNFSRYKKISQNYIRKYNSVVPTINRFSLQNVKKGKYKIVHPSRYVLKKSMNSGCTEPLKSNSVSKSVYSINRVKNTIPRMNPQELIIELNDEDSGNEGDYPSTLTINEKSNDSISNQNDVRNQSYDEAMSVVLENDNDTRSASSEITGDTLMTESKVRADCHDILPVTTIDVPVSDGDVHVFEEYHSPATSEVTSIGNCDTLSCNSIVEDAHEVVCPAGEILTDEAISSKTTTLNVVESNTCSITAPDDVVIQKENLTEEVKETTTCFVDNSETEYPAEIPEPELGKTPETKEDTPTATDSIPLTNNKPHLFVLADAEANLIKIRARLLFNLNELEESIKKEKLEKDKLNIMFKKLINFKSMIFKFEDGIKSQKSKLLLHSKSVQSLFKDVTIRAETCAQLKGVCVRAGVKIMGPQYKPPDTYETLIEDKRKVIDFPKNVPSNFKYLMNV